MQKLVVITEPERKTSVQIGIPALQEHCLLFGLPIELRELIYHFVFGPSLIHIQAIVGRLAHVRCLKWQPGDGWDGHPHGLNGGLLGTVKLDSSEDPNDQLLAFCLSCRLMYVNYNPSPEYICALVHITSC